MEIQLQELIDQIKKDGVEKAEAEAKRIVDTANVQAEKIILAAKEEADALLANAKIENDRVVKSSEEAIRQAGRNLLISFRQSVERELNAILCKEVETVYSPDMLMPLIVNVIERWVSKPEAEDIAVILNSDELKSLEETLLAGLKDRLGKGVTLKVNDNFDGGFHIAVDKGRAYYDYSTEAVVKMLSEYLSPKVTVLLKEAE